MLHDYKGETPKNVITEEEHKKRPFYKKVSFWVLSALGLFFGGCSVYGLVLGYQYVQAVTQAAHIIADANSGEDVSDLASLNRHRLNAQTNNGNVRAVLLSSLSWQAGWGGWYTGDLQNLIKPVETQFGAPNLVCDRYINTNWGTFQDKMISQIANGSSDEFNNYIVIRDSDFSNTQDFVASLTGVYLYYQSLSTYTGDTAVDVAYDQGYSDGSDAINLPQSVRVATSVSSEVSVQYKAYLDGVVDQEGQIGEYTPSGTFAIFQRARNQKLRIDLTLPSGSRAFFLYVPFWTASYPNDENYPLRQSWAVSGVTYLPTWVTQPELFVDVTSANVPDLTFETISVAFDVDHWGDTKVGAYSEGYSDGFQAGESNPTAYDSGYQDGYSQGYDDGKVVGINQGESQAVSGQKALVTMFVTAFQQPFDQIYRFLNFNVLGLNILALFTSLLTLSIGIIIIKKVI